jgi:hypothetical protein
MMRRNSEERMKLVVAGILCGWVSIAAAQPGAGAPPPPPPPGGGGGYGYGPQPGYGYEDPGAHRHDGFYLRMWIGPGYTQMKLDDADLEVSGTGGSFGIQAGVAVQENLILYGQLFDDIAVNPSIKQGGMSADLDNVNAGVVGFGAGVTYYFMPSNMYVSGAVTYTQLSVQRDGEEIGESDWGPGVSLMVGKEWWVSNNWGVGVALQLFGGSMKDSTSEGSPTWSTGAAALAFSATYN